MGLSLHEKGESVELRYFIKAFILPPGLLLLPLLAAFIWFHRQYVAKTLLLMSILALYLLSTSAMSNLLTAPLQDFDAVSVSHEQWSDYGAIVVLGGGVMADAPEYGGPSVESSSLERVRYGAYLGKASGLPLFMSGGTPLENMPAVASLMADVAKDEFAVDNEVWFETSSRTTWENAQESWQMLTEKGIKKIVLVTQAWHMKRSVESFEAVGFEVLPAPTGFLRDRQSPWYVRWLPTVGSFYNSVRSLHEHMGLMWYRLRYY